MQQKFNITGMSCSACSAHIEKEVRKLDGIKSANVNLLSNNMVAEYNEKELNKDEIIKVITEAGYGAYVADNGENKEDTKTYNNQEINNTINSMKKRFIISIIFLIPLMYISMGHMFSQWFNIPVLSFLNKYFHGTENAITFSFTQFLLVLPIVYVNRNYFIVGFKSLIKKSPNMDSLIAIGSTAAILYGIVAIFRIGYGLGNSNLDIVNRYLMDIYFESAGTILTLITLGKYLETKSKGKTSKSIEKLINLSPDVATIFRDNKEVEISSKDIKLNDIVIVKSGGIIPIDGRIIEGMGIIDQSAITGESIPVDKSIGDNVVAGTINKSGYIKIVAEKVGRDTTLAQIIQLVENASNSKAPISKLADKISGVFVPIVILIAVISSLIWIILGQSFEFALSIGIAVLVISCPCALGLATPVAIMVGTGKGAENGILFKDAESLEILHKVDTVIFDKTGTITEGTPAVTDIVPLKGNISDDILLKIFASLEMKSEHPLAVSVVNKGKERNIIFEEVKNFSNNSGKGIQGEIDGKTYYVGNIKFINENCSDISNLQFRNKEYEEKGKTIIYLADVTELIGFLALMDSVKKDSKFAIEELKNMNVNSIMITGDNRFSAESIGKEINISKVISEVLPQDKEKVVSELQKEGKIVAMCGDGINDSPALAKSNVGIAIGSGTDIAIESANVILMNSNILDIVTAIKLSKNVMRNIKTNLFWAFFYNIIGIPLAAGVFYIWLGWKLNPMFGAAAMSLSSTFVVLNALRIKNFKVNYNNKKGEKIMKKIVYVDGMKCMHCKKAVEEAVKNLKGVKDVVVDLEENNVTIEAEKDIDLKIVKKAIEDKGYNVIDK